MRQMTDTDVVVATRYHNIVCALMVEKPTISVGYAAKNDALLDAMGLEGFCQRCESFDLDLLSDQLERLIHDRECFGKQIAETTRAYRRLLEQQEARLVAKLI